jgi:hypothetical protein
MSFKFANLINICTRYKRIYIIIYKNSNKICLFVICAIVVGHLLFQILNHIFYNFSLLEIKMTSKFFEKLTTIFQKFIDGLEILWNYLKNQFKSVKAQFWCIFGKLIEIIKDLIVMFLKYWNHEEGTVFTTTLKVFWKLVKSFCGWVYQNLFVVDLNFENVENEV